VVLPAGTHLLPTGKKEGLWLEVTVVDQPGAAGWISAKAVKLDDEPIAALDKQAFAADCSFQASIFGVSAHYIAAVATLRTDVKEVSGPDGTGPLAFTGAEWALNATQPAFKLEAAALIGSWRTQVAVFAIMTRLAQQRLVAVLGTQPTVAELHLSQLVGSQAAGAALRDKSAKIADIVAKIDAGEAKGEGIDLSNLGKRDARLIGNGTVQETLDAISKALNAALETAKPFIRKAGAQAVANANAALSPEGPVTP
jgi:hypothetical protein